MEANEELLKQPLAVMKVCDFVRAITETPEVRKLFQSLIKSVLTDEEIEKVIEDEKNERPRTVRGITGIASIFGCSLPTAQRLKKTVIKDAVSQRGRLIITDVEKAKKLFKNYQAQNGPFSGLPKTA